ncbi:fructokinase [Modestobacter sp. DSM 44400]|uniref:PfkB family carbohydrate kinase n=1 Tax=Modestobacter sp. DSM 44400 TaxID=1550230 RepID=UPI00089D6A76|nr:PfkB family carbohydrate kinase [Modestobacter sp. DSM 44400]SDY56367.1 fructokinase [Modestobacter sp. DSM 44400]
MITVCGELVIDLIPASSPAPPAGHRAAPPPPQYAAFPGGNALNVAVAAARLGNVVHLMSRVGPGPFGTLLRDHATRNGVSPDALLAAAEPVSLAVVELSDTGSAGYSFHTVGAADWQWTADELARTWPADTRIVHVGSISSWTPPGSVHIADLVRRARSDGRALVSFDPNVRPSLIADAAAVRARITDLRRTADLVKVSAEDVAWLEPGADLDDVVTRWATEGPALVVITDGDQPLRAARAGGTLLRRRPPVVTVVDTVGAGDTFAAGFFSGLVRTGVLDRVALLGLPDDDLAALLDDAALAAALACTRAGANPPTLEELTAARG